MERQRQLIEELRRRPDEEPASRRNPRMATGIAVAAALALGAASAWYITSRSSGAQVAARPVSAAATPSPATVPSAAPSPSGSLDASGYIVARRQATVAAKITGRVLEVPIEEGQSVEQGQVLARLDDSNARTELAREAAERSRAQAALASARVALDDARPIFRRAEQQYREGVLSAQQFDMGKAEYNRAVEAASVAERADAVAAANLAIARQNVDDTVIRAPFGGIVTAKTAQPGEVVSPVSAGGGFTRTGICTVVDRSSLELQVDVSESFISRVRTGQPAVVTLNAYPGWQIPAEVSGILPAADRSKGTVRVRLALRALDPRILPDMSARASFR
ncbi:MAG TPA: efflux RND transporter periplasmic adaptor subunit [Thermoanaerobaculia bacterium]